ncbi:Glucose-6-phosphate exchanger SLC37A2 [Eumeta japonica]|uniref:Glucose-6-phosphate exchanger SLC37A2 n=1 Tax=Eumeta variegata TaxID=151549 RepID=A0A4C1X2J8_EUMVA|nr:Glucose-6-phosphate exchanger SLC37A2 [Eumeta japonica]
MNGINKEAPAGIQFSQKLSEVFCPRLRFNRLRCYQALVLFLTYLTYMTYHLTRKPISVVKGQLHRNCSAFPPTPGTSEAVTPTTPPTNDYWCDWPPFNTTDANTLLGTLDSAFLFSYAGAMFISGRQQASEPSPPHIPLASRPSVAYGVRETNYNLRMVAERVDLRYFLSIGMLLSGIFCYLFGLAKTLDIHNLSYYLLVQAGAGIAQTTGWPGTVAIVGKWFGNAKKGLIFGIWNSHTSLGNILGTLLAAEFVESNWALSFAYPGLVMGAVGFLVFLLLPADPRCVGIVIEERNSPSRHTRRSINEDEPTQVIVGDQAHRLLVEAYNEAALSERTSREWFQKFENGDFDVEDKDRSGWPKIYEDAELKELLEEDSSQTQKELALILEVIQQAVSNRLKSLEMIHKQGTRKSFLHRIVTGDEKWIYYDNPKRRKSWGPPGHAATSTAKPNIHKKKLLLFIWWDQLGMVYYELLNPREIITGTRYRTHLMRLNKALKENAFNTTPDTTKLFFYMIMLVRM